MFNKIFKQNQLGVYFLILFLAAFRVNSDHFHSKQKASAVLKYTIICIFTCWSIVTQQYIQKCFTSHMFLNVEVENLKTEEAHVTFKTKENVSSFTENNIKPSTKWEKMKFTIQNHNKCERKSLQQASA